MERMPLCKQNTHSTDRQRPSQDFGRRFRVVPYDSMKSDGSYLSFLIMRTNLSYVISTKDSNLSRYDFGIIFKGLCCLYFGLIV